MKMPITNGNVQWKKERTNATGKEGALFFKPVTRRQQNDNLKFLGEAPKKSHPSETETESKASRKWRRHLDSQKGRVRGGRGLFTSHGRACAFKSNDNHTSSNTSLKSVESGANEMYFHSKYLDYWSAHCAVVTGQLIFMMRSGLESWVRRPNCRLFGVEWYVLTREVDE